MTVLQEVYAAMLICLFKILGTALNSIASKFSKHMTTNSLLEIMKRRYQFGICSLGSEWKYDECRDHVVTDFFVEDFIRTLLWKLSHCCSESAISGSHCVRGHQLVCIRNSYRREEGDYFLLRKIAWLVCLTRLPRILRIYNRSLCS